jgi:hypothetical protein
MPELLGDLVGEPRRTEELLARREAKMSHGTYGRKCNCEECAPRIGKHCLLPKKECIKHIYGFHFPADDSSMIMESEEEITGDEFICTHCPLCEEKL